VNKRLGVIDKAIDANMVVMCRCFDASQRIVNSQISTSFHESGKEVVEIDGVYALTLEIFRAVSDSIELHELDVDGQQELINEWLEEQKAVAEHEAQERAAALAEIERQNEIKTEKPTPVEL
jgi:hypothetical protein